MYFIINISNLYNISKIYDKYIYSILTAFQKSRTKTVLQKSCISYNKIDFIYYERKIYKNI